MRSDVPRRLGAVWVALVMAAVILLPSKAIRSQEAAKPSTRKSPFGVWVRTLFTAIPVAPKAG